MEGLWCRWAWENMVILSDGRVTCSCYDPLGAKELGNVQDQSVWEIWNGPGYRRIREEIRSGRLAFCKGCRQLQPMDPTEAANLPVEVRKLPRKIYIEPSAVCNLRCGAGLKSGSADFCNPAVLLKHRKAKLMPLALFQRILDEVYADLEDLELFNYGETFLNPDAVRMIAYAKKKKDGIFVFSSTNGHHFDTEEKRLALVRSGIDRLMFSVDGTDQATYEKYRKGGCFHRVIENLRAVAALKKKLNLKTPFLEWRYILFRWNDSDAHLEKAVRMAREAGVDRLTWHLTCWPEGAPSERFAPGGPDHERIKHELYTTPGSNALASRPAPSCEPAAPPRPRLAPDSEAMRKKHANQLLIHHQMQQGAEHVIGYPYHAIVDPTNRCQLKCPFCPAGNGSLKQPRGSMSLPRFKTLMDLLGPHLFELSLYNWGEPFLNREIFDMIRYAKPFQVFTRISSNLNHFGAERAEALVASGVDELIVSADGLCQETYARYRVGGDLDKVLENLRHIEAAKKHAGEEHPRVVWQFLAFRHNEHEIPRAESFGLAAGANQVKVIPAWVSDPEWAPLDERYSRYKKTEGAAAGCALSLKKPVDASCNWLWNSIVINWDGSVHPCCSHHDEDKSFGNLFEEPFEKVWNGKRYREARRFVRTGLRSEDANLCFACQIIGQRNFHDRYLKQNPLIGSISEEELERRIEKLRTRRTAAERPDARPLKAGAERALAAASGGTPAGRAAAGQRGLHEEKVK